MKGYGEFRVASPGISTRWASAPCTRAPLRSDRGPRRATGRADQRIVGSPPFPERRPAQAHDSVHGNMDGDRRLLRMVGVVKDVRIGAEANIATAVYVHYLPTAAPGLELRRFGSRAVRSVSRWFPRCVMRPNRSIVMFRSTSEHTLSNLFLLTRPAPFLWSLWHLCLRRTAVGLAWRLRRDLLRGDSANSGDRRSDCSRGAVADVLRLVIGQGEVCIARSRRRSRGRVALSRLIAHVAPTT